MSFQVGRGFHNPLLQRVRRHSRISTLFRAPSVVQPAGLLSSVFQTYSEPIDNPGVVQATLGSVVGATASISGEPIPIAMPIQETRRPLPVQRAPVSPVIDTGISQPAVSPLPSVHPPEQKATPVISNDSNIIPPSRETTPSILPETSPAKTEADSTITDSVWSRLQNIFRRHQNPPTTAQQIPVREPDSMTQQDVPPSPQAAPAGEGPSLTDSAPKGETASPQQTTAPVQRTLRPSATIQRSLEPETITQPENVIRDEREGSAEITQLPQNIDRPDTPLSTEKMVVDEPDQRGLRVSFSAQESIPELSQPVEIDRPQEIIPPSATSPIQPTIQARSAEKRSVPAIQHSPTTPIQLTEEQQEIKLEAQSQDTTQTVPPPSPTAPVIQRSIGPPGKQQDESTPQQVVISKVSTPEDLSQDIVSANEEISLLDVETTRQTAPLQDVWQVERRLPPSRSSQPRQAAPARQQTSPPVQQERERPGRDLQDNITRVLDSIAAGGPTSSSIEVVEPRHPRPVPLQVSRRPQQPTIMREPAAPQAQKQSPITAQDAPIPTAEAVVDTAIGPLPADLWTLINEPVPPGVRMQQSVVERDAGQTENVQPVSQPQPVRQEYRETAPKPAVASQQTQQETGIVAPRRSSMPGPTRRVSAPSVSAITPTPSRIQRVAAPSERVDTSSDTAQRSTSELDAGASSQEQQQDESQSEESGVDIDDLARKVYAEIKRKLAVEWERIRTRF